jgi:hypothetical protein
MWPWYVHDHGAYAISTTSGYYCPSLEKGGEFVDIKKGDLVEMRN